MKDIAYNSCIQRIICNDFYTYMIEYILSSQTSGRLSQMLITI